MLERIEAIAADTPLEEQDESRFGNKAFRTFHQKFTEVQGRYPLNRHSPSPLALLLSVAYFLLQASDALLLDFLGEEHADAVVELGPYLRDAFGNATRIDYGSGQWPGVYIPLGLKTHLVQSAPECNRPPANPPFSQRPRACLCCVAVLRLSAENLCRGRRSRLGHTGVQPVRVALGVY